MNASVAGKNIIIVYSKADILGNLPEKITQYLASDNLWANLDALKRVDLGEKDMVSYVEDMNYISNRIRDFTIDQVDGGLNSINTAETNGINLRFCVTSALGNSTDQENTMTVPIAPQRVLDPLYWIMELDLKKNSAV